MVTAAQFKAHICIIITIYTRFDVPSKPSHPLHQLFILILSIRVTFQKGCTGHPIGYSLNFFIFFLFLACLFFDASARLGG